MILGRFITQQQHSTPAAEQGDEGRDARHAQRRRSAGEQHARPRSQAEQDGDGSGKTRHILESSRVLRRRRRRESHNFGPRFRWAPQIETTTITFHAACSPRRGGRTRYSAGSAAAR